MSYWSGQTIRLRAPEKEDALHFFNWNKSDDHLHYLDFVWPPASLEAQKIWIEKRITENSIENLFLVIENLAGQFAGMIHANRCVPRNGTFRYAIALLPEFRKMGYAAEAIRLLLRYYFLELRYQKVTVNIDAENIASIKLHQSLGFQLEGRLRRMIYANGKWSDELFYGLTIEEFRGINDF